MPDSALARLVKAARDPGGWIISGVEMIQESHGSGRQDPGWFHPSDFGHHCDAFLAFRYLGAPAQENISARTRRIFDNGSGRDEWLKRDFKRAGLSLIKKESDRKIVIPELHIRGELDDWLENPVTKERAVIDIKTMHLKEWESLDVVKPAHYLQILPYEFAKNTPKGYVLYECKNDQQFKLKEANFKNAVWQEQVVDRITKILEGLDKGYVNRNPISCSNCPFFENGTCTNNQIAKLKEESKLWQKTSSL